MLNKKIPHSSEKILLSRFQGLYPLIACSVVGVAAVILLKIRLAVEPKVPNERACQTPGVCRLPFWFIFAMAMPAAVSTTILAVLLPMVLVDGLDFDLTFGGLSTTMFGLGGAAGSFVWAYAARKKNELNCAIIALFLARWRLRSDGYGEKGYCRHRENCRNY